MKKNNLFILTLFMLLFLSSKSLAAVQVQPQITAQAGILVDYNSKQILYSKNIDAKLGPASTTKIMTALITLEKCKLDDKVTIGKVPPFEEGSKIYLIEGETLTVQQLLYGLLLDSANDCALALAEYIGGSKEGFAKIMNEKAVKLGCKNTNFTNPSGLYDPKHYTTAYDLSLITIEALKNPEFRKIISTLSYQIAPTNKQPKVRYLHNHNKLLFSKRYKYTGADGVKTGYTVKTKHTYVGSATRGERQLIAVTLMNEKTSYDDVKVLFDYGFSNFTQHKVLSKDDILDNSSIPVHPESDVYLTLPIGQSLPQNINKKVYIDNSIDKIERGTIVGNLEVSTDNGYKTCVPVVSVKDYTNSILATKIDSKTYKKLAENKLLLIGAASFTLLVFILAISVFKYRRNKY